MSPWALLSVVGDELDTRLGSKRVDCRRRGRRPAAGCAEVHGVGTKVCQGGEAHRVDGRFGDAEAERLGSAEPEQHLGASRGNAAPMRSAFFPAGDGSVHIPMRGPDAAMRPLAQETGGGCGAQNGGKMTTVSQVGSTPPIRATACAGPASDPLSTCRAPAHGSCAARLARWPRNGRGRPPDSSSRRRHALEMLEQAEDIALGPRAGRTSPCPHG